MAAGGLSGAIFNAAKERALDHFIAGRVRFTDMNVIVEDTLSVLATRPEARCDDPTLDVVAHMDHLARDEADRAAMMRQV